MNILSIQSHVSYGHVGNAVAVFVLQRLGSTVWPVHTVHFSNHTGYPDWKGTVASAEQIAALIDGLDARGALAQCDAVLTGYIGSAALGAVVAETVERVKAQNPQALYCCDPVMGDTGRGFYVDKAIPAFMAERAVPLADILTPNPFELETLVGRPLPSLEALDDAAQEILARGPAKVLVTSVTENEKTGAIGMMASNSSGAWLATSPVLDFAVNPNGAGDATAAFFLGYSAMSKMGKDDAWALGKTKASVNALLEATQATGGRELDIVGAQDAFAEATPVETRQIR